MQRKPSHYFRKSVTALLAAAAGLVLGMQVEANHFAVQRAPASHFVTQGPAGASVPLVAIPVLLISDPTHRVKTPRECRAGIEADCTYI